MTCPDSGQAIGLKLRRMDARLEPLRSTVPVIPRDYHMMHHFMRDNITSANRLVSGSDCKLLKETHIEINLFIGYQ